MSDGIGKNKPALIAVAAVVVAVAVFACCDCGSDSDSDPRNDFLSRRFAYNGVWPTDGSGPQPVPFHNWNSDFFAVWLDADADAVRAQLQGTGLHPILTTAGRAVMGLWSYKYHDSTAGAYSESVIVLSATRDAAKAPISDEPMDWVEGLLFDANYTNFVPKLWLNKQMPIDWGRDILGANKFAAHVTIQMPGGASGSCAIDVTTDSGKDTAQEVVWRASIPAVGLAGAVAANVGMLRAFSLRNIWTALTAQTITLPIVFTKGVIHKAFDQTVCPEVLNVLKNDPPAVLQYWPSDATFSAGSEIASYKATPRLVQRASPGRFVMFAPANVPPAGTVKH